MTPKPRDALREALVRIVRGEDVPEFGAAVGALGLGGESDGELAGLLASLPAMARGDRRREAARALRLLRAGAAMEGSLDLGHGEAAPAAQTRRRERRPKARVRSEKPEPSDPLDHLVDAIPGIGPRGAEALAAQQIRTVADLIELLPRDYQDRRRIVSVGDLQPGVWAVVDGTVVRSRIGGPPWARRLSVVVESGGGDLDVVFFHARPGMSDRFRPGTMVRLAGTPRLHGHLLQLAHPEIVGVGAEADGPGRVAPRYPVVRGLAPRVLARAIGTAIERQPIDDVLTPGLRERLGLPDRHAALTALHQPDAELSVEDLDRLRAGTSPAHRLLAAEELFLHEVLAASRRDEVGHAVAPALTDAAAAAERVARVLPFPLTGAQTRTLREIAEDLTSERPMRRLLQGDVGSGKTVVALGAVLAALDAAKQAVILAPTELLAVQHARTLAPWLDALGHRAVLVLGSQGSSARKKARRSLELGSAGLAIGTHALLTETVEIPHLAVCVVDEQHRFGVAQRLRVVEKGRTPHLLVMSATPIPRTLALAIHGDLAISVLDERPPGRRPPVTSVHGPDDRESVFAAVGEALDAGERGFVICPLVEESEEVRHTAAVPLYDELKKRYVRHAVALVHGRLGADEKVSALEGLAAGRVQLLVATTIVEVGIDVPDARFVVIDGAERFGLSQLHQIRGRVGRGEASSRCFLVHGDVGGEAVARIESFAETDDGFRVAELDLALRGPGDLTGLRQSGLSGLSFADPLRDVDLLLPAREEARALRGADPDLSAPEHRGLGRAIRRRWPVTGRPIREEAG